MVKLLVKVKLFVMLHTVRSFSFVMKSIVRITFPLRKAYLSID